MQSGITLAEPERVYVVGGGGRKNNPRPLSSCDDVSAAAAGRGAAGAASMRTSEADKDLLTISPPIKKQLLFWPFRPKTKAKTKAIIGS